MILAIDTAGLPSQVILFDQEKQVLAEKSWSEEYSQSRKTLIIIEQLLKKLKGNLSDLSMVIVNQGPTTSADKEASFTGLKIGATVTNGLSLALKIPIIGISLKGRQLREIVEKTDLIGQREDFITPIYPKPPNITQPKS